MTDVQAPEETLEHRLSDLWSDERCVWRVEYEEALNGDDDWWRLDLEWSSEYGNEHHADWATYTWQFYGHSPNEVMADAVTFCVALLPFKRCGACGGEGAYNRAVGGRVACEDCGGSGLDSDVKAPF